MNPTHYESMSVIGANEDNCLNWAETKSLRPLIAGYSKSVISDDDVCTDLAFSSLAYD